MSVVGAGNFGRLVLLPQLAKCRGVSLQGVCTAKGLAAARTGDKYGFQYVTADPRAIVDDPDTDVVIVLTRHALHADLVLAARQAGKHVFVEKPLCITAAALQRITDDVNASAHGGPMLMVGFNRRFARALAPLKRHFDGVAPLSVSYRFAAPELRADAWPQDLEIGGGRIVGEACHAIDLCIAIAGSTITRVFAESVSPVGRVQTPDDRVFVTMRHANGSVSSISYQAGGDAALSTERVEVFGGGRTGIIDDWSAVELWSAGRRRTVNGGKDKGHEAELQAFVNACRSGGEWLIPWAELQSASWASLAALQSLRTGQPVDRETVLD